MITINFNTESEKNSLIDTYLQNGYVLSEIQYLFTGNSLIFEKSTDLINRVSSLETTINIENQTASERYLSIFNNPSSTVEDIKKAKIAQLKELCTLAIYNGFDSSIGHSFGFNEIDQTNFTQQSVLIVLNNLLDTDIIQWKSIDSGVLDLSITQFKIIVDEAKTHKLTQQKKYWQLESQVNIATTKTEVDSIVW